MSGVLHLAASGLLAIGLLAASSAVGAGAADGGDARGGAGDGGRHWVHTWTAMPQLTEPANMPPEPFTGEDVVLADATLRQTVRATIGGDDLRLRFSNAFGGAPLPLTEVSVALPRDGRAGAAAIEPGSARPVTFHERSATTVPPGAHVVSDPLPFRVLPGTDLTVTVYLAEGQASLDITSHPGSRTTSHLLAGNHVDAAELPGATPTDHWYFLSGLEVRAPGGTGAAVVVGDSLTDGRGSTTNMNDRWPDQLFDRLDSRPATAGTAVLNQAAGGNRVLNDGLGPNLLARLDRDVLAASGAEWLVVFHGVNDIGTAAATPAAQADVTAQLLAAYDQIVTRAHAQGIRVYGATLPPFGGNEMYDDAAGLRAETRQAVNTWIREAGRFDAVIDFDAAVRDPADPGRLLPAADVGDHLHLNPHGYGLLADAVPARLFR
ncbi:SGNH/GDSL hydrolase family protein [Streptomyces johnsoniae]|uniref:SGNH/GDSL hydrolase family protein n=1 Tax=Streptomyces johnsoniae TaxID=3075532 RepID=A0ABU2S2A2_9ACTN|nr:SGNH/GDSL hydrolase family protein [Streptomyces sp. DSM 41886]MDT0443123.1 SGNH/GDSL hydrolase family protein [Streptomyces sp. DSM 41886]